MLDYGKLSSQGSFSTSHHTNAHISSQKLTTWKGLVAALILILKDLRDPAFEVWQRIYQILSWMGKDGMSLEESGNENGHAVICVHHFQWR